MQQIRIGELAKAANVNLETVRYYEREGLLPKPPRTESGYRMFPRDAVHKLRFIKTAQELGFSLGEIKDLLDLRLSSKADRADVRQRAEAKIAEIENKIRALKRMKDALTALLGACSGHGPSSECPILASIDMTATRSFGER